MRPNLRLHIRIALLTVLVLFSGPSARSQTSQTSQSVEIDVNATAHAFPHFWEKVFGSGRAILSLRDSYRQDLRETKRITGVEYVRFHAIFHDEVGVYDEDASGKPIYNFSYVDQIYDGLLENNVRAFLHIARRKMSQWISLHPTSTETTRPKMFSAPAKIFRATKWYAAR